MNLQIVGDRLYELRMKQGKTMRQVSEEVILLGERITPGTICNLESAKSEPLLGTIMVLAKYYDVSLDYIAGRINDTK